MKLTKFLLFVLFTLYLIIFTNVGLADTKLIVNPNGDAALHAKNELRRFEHSSVEATGLYVKKGDKIVITAKGVTKAKVLLGLFGTYQNFNDGQSNAFEEYDLKNGENTFLVSQDIGQVYIENLSESQEIEVSIQGGRHNPLYRLGDTSEEDFKKQLTNYSEAPFFELVGDKSTGLFLMDESNLSALKKRDDIGSLLEYIDRVVESEATANGLFYGDSSLGNNLKYNNKVLYVEGDQSFGAAYTVGKFCAFGSSMMQSLLSWKPGDNLWGFWHEVGHTYQNPYMIWSTDGDEGVYPGYNLSEVTVNINSIYIQNQEGTGGHFDGQQGHREEIKKFLSSDNEGKDFDTTSASGFKPDTDTSCWIKIGFFNQLMIAYGYDIFAHVNQEYRMMYALGDKMPSTNEEKRQCFMKILSRVTQRNLIDYFEKWGFHPNDDVKNENEKYKKPTVPIEDNLIPGQDDPIIDSVVEAFQLPTGKIKKVNYILGAQPSDFNINDIFDTTTFKNRPSGNIINPTTEISTVNDLLENSSLKVKLTNEQGQSNIYNVPIERSYGNAISMTAYGSEERAIFTLQKNSKTIETFTKESQDTTLTAGNNQFVHFMLYSKNGSIKKEEVCNENESPQDFVHALRNIHYSEGDVLELKILTSGKLQSYKDGKIDLERTKSQKNEFFKIENDQFVHLSDDDLLSAQGLDKSLKIGEGTPEPVKMIDNVKSLFGNETLAISYADDNLPNLNVAGKQKIAILLKDKITGKELKISSSIDVQYDNSLALAGYLANDIRAVLRLDKESGKIIAISDRTRTTSISSNNSKYWEIKIFRAGQMIKDVQANGSDKPFSFVDSLDETNYKEGDIVYIYAYQKFINNYQANQLVVDSYDNDNYFKINDNKFRKITLSNNISIGKSHLLYEKNESLTEDEILKDAEVTTGEGSTLVTDFDGKLTNSLGNHTVKITSKNSITGEEVSKELLLSIVEPATTVDDYIKFTDNDPILTVGKPKELEVGITSGKNSIKKITLKRENTSNELHLGNEIKIKKQDEEWENQTIDTEEELDINFDNMKSDTTYNIRYELTASSELEIKNGESWQITYLYVNKIDDIEKEYTKTQIISSDIEAREDSESNNEQLKNEGTISFRKDDQAVNPVDPTDPSIPVIPDNPINPQGAELMITYASNINFGIQNKLSHSCHALLDHVRNTSDVENTREVVPFVSIKDSRGAERDGWKLEVTRDDDFKDSKGNILEGAELIYSDLNYAEQQNSPEAIKGDIVISEAASVIAIANENQGSGLTSLALGYADNMKKGDEKTTTGVVLNILPGTNLNDDCYTTSITYELVAGV